MKKRLLSLVLCFVMVFTLMSVAGFAEEGATANSGAEITNPPTAFTTRRDLSLDKVLSDNGDGTFNLQLSSYATGKIETKVVTQQTPTDFICVVDQSGSMAYKDMPKGYEAVTNKTTWKMSDIPASDSNSGTTDGAYYYKDPNTGDYYRVYKKWGAMYELVPRNSLYLQELINRNSLSWFRDAGEQTQSFDSMYYYQPSADPLISHSKNPDKDLSNDHHFYPLKMEVQNAPLYYYMTFSYNDINNNPRTMKYYYNKDTLEAPRNNSGVTYVPTYSDSNSIIYYNSVSNGGIFGPGQSFALSYKDINRLVVYAAGEGTSPVGAIANSVFGGYPDEGFYYRYTYAQALGMNTGMFVQNPMFIGHTGYHQLCYRDSNGVEHYLIDTDYCDSNDVPLDNMHGQEATWNGTLYRVAGTSDGTPQTESRLQALNTSLKTFVDEVAGQTDSDGSVRHRIAIVGFSSENTSNYKYDNNEILSGVNVTHGDPGSMSSTPNTTSGYSLDGRTHNGTAYSGNISQDTYYGALVDTATADRTLDQTKVDSLKDSVDAITAYGGTQPEIGFAMAQKIIEARNAKDPTASSRNTVVIFFTDGRPGNHSYDNQYEEAGQVVLAAKGVKDLGATVYSVGIFNEADGNPLTYRKSYGIYDPSTISTNRDKGCDASHGLFYVHWNNGSLGSQNGYSVSAYMDRLKGEGFIVEQKASNGKYIQEYDTNFVKKEEGTTGLRYSQKWEWDGSHYAQVIFDYYRMYFYYRDCLDSTYGYPEQPDDTIADYMTTVSSTYKNASSFDGGWSTSPGSNYTNTINSARGKAGNKNYYMLCTNTERLEEVFVNISHDVDVAGTTVNLDGSAVLKDIVNTDVFAVPAKSQIEVYTQEMAASDNNGVVTYYPTGDPVLSSELTNQATVDNDVVRVTGFDYEHHYVMPNQTDPAIVGQKLIVVIKNLKLKKLGNALESNIGAGIYAVDESTGDESTVPVLSITSPILDTKDAFFAVQKVKVVQTSDGRGLEEDGDKTLYLKSDYTQTQKFSITEKVSDDFLYGGTYEQFNNGTLTSPCTFGNDSGLGFIPDANKTYYLKEVPNTYLRTKNLFRYSGPNLTDSYFITSIDSYEDYYQTGFVINETPVAVPEVYRYIVLANGPIAGSGKTSTQLSVYVSDKTKDAAKIDQDLKDVPISENETQTINYQQWLDEGNLTVKNASSPAVSGYLSLTKIESADEQSASAYWITHDGVLVTGTNVRNVKNFTINGEDGTSTKTPEKADGTEFEGQISHKTAFVAADDSEEEVIEPVDDGIKLAGYTASLNGNIAMNFYLELSEEVAADEDAYMQFKLPGTNHTEEVVKLTDAQKVTMGGKTYYVFSAGIAAKDMTSNIQAQFIKGDKTTSEAWNYTIKEYCDYIRNHPDAYDAESVALAEAMLNYGGYTQKYFNHNVKNLANEGLNVALPEVEPDDSFNPEESGACEGLTYLGTSAMLTTVTALNHYFEFKGDPSDYTFTANGKELKVETDSNGSYVQITGVKAKDLDKPITLTVKDKAGNTYTLNYSVYTNVMQVVAGEFPDNAKNMMKALYGYGEAAKAYFASRK